jgi:L-aminopeptidase/D-esterase-like protein
VTLDADSGADATRSVVVGAVAVVNSNGSPVDPATGRLWEHPATMLRSPSRADARRIRELLEAESATPSPRLNTTIGVVTTSAALSKAETSKMAAVAHDGLARAIRPAHSMFDGDTIFGLATGAVGLGAGPTVIRESGSRHHEFNLVLRAAADTFAAACAHAIASAVGIGSSPAYLDVCPSAGRPTRTDPPTPS